MACVCFAFGIIFFVIAFVLAIGFLMCVMTISFALSIDLYKSLRNPKNGPCTIFFLKDTKLLIFLPWSSRKQSTSFISSNSILVFSTCSILSAKADPLVCVDLVF